MSVVSSIGTTISLEEATSAFFKAVEGGDLEAAKAVAGKTSVNVKDIDDCAALFEAAQKGHSSMVELLISLGADTNITGYVSAITCVSPSVNLRRFSI